MKKNRLLLFLLFFIAFYASQPVFGQKPRKIISQADKAYFNDDWENARKLYEKAVSLQPDNIKVNYRLGYLLFEQNQPAAAIPYLEKAQKLSLKFNSQYANVLAQAYQLAAKFEEAQLLYQTLLNKTSRKEEIEKERLSKRITECISGKVLMAQKPSADIRNLNSGINSAEADYAPILTNKDQSLYFTSRRATGESRRQATEDIYVVQRSNEGWGKPQALGKTINTTEHEAATAVSADGQTLYLYRDHNNGDIFEAKKSGSNWGKLKALNEPVNSKAFEPSFFIVPDNQFAFFSSDRDGGFGGLDLYVTMKQPDGSWSEAMNLGANINTAFDEDAPFVDVNGTLFFSSRGHNSMGGYDIFSSSAEGAAWTQASNLGYPVNTPFDDIYFNSTGNGLQAFFSSDRAGGVGEKDIYEATFRRETATDSLLASADTVVIPEPEPIISKTLVKAESKKVLVKSIVRDAVTNLPVIARVVFKVKNKTVPDITLIADSVTGRFSAELDKSQPYVLEVRSEGYFYFTEELNIPLAYNADTLEKNIALKKIKTGEKFVLRNIFFEYGKNVLTKSSRAELNRLVSFLSENPKIKVEISGHTDNKGKAAYNQALSLKRAKAVVNYLINKGVARTRLVAVGYGSRKPIASNRFEEGRKQNRRTEFKVLAQ